MTSAYDFWAEPTHRAIKFLNLWRPEGPHVLSAIDPDRAFIETRGFGPDDPEMFEWVMQWQAVRGIYWMPNRDLRPIDSIDLKAKKIHIGEVSCLVVDVDPYKCEDAEVGRARVLRMLTEELPPGVPGPPSVIILSGNGFNAVWALREPIVINGDLAKAAVVERHGEALAHAFGGDAVFNCDRVLRLPYSLNMPSPKKRKLGLVPVLARVIRFDLGLRYDLDQFPAVEPPQAATRAARATKAGQAGMAARKPQRADVALADRIAAAIGAPEAVDDLDELQVSARTRIIIDVGHYPGEDSSDRSAWLFRAIKALIHAGESDEVILGVIGDPTWGISGSVIDKPDPEQYARRQIGRAHARICAELELEWPDDPEH